MRSLAWASSIQALQVRGAAMSEVFKRTIIVVPPKDASDETAAHFEALASHGGWQTFFTGVDAVTGEEFLVRFYDGHDTASAFEEPLQ